MQELCVQELCVHELCADVVCAGVVCALCCPHLVLLVGVSGFLPYFP